ncbi:hypothetical protein CSB45_15700 [candidate division KSB3 bacterium]|uniref:Lysine exporter LysO family protein n=1 Tax=candidate division KSB3 bacterium TaxID=2044937 RepID=A0A2G6E0C2_9BACT|nr:MAG: hypothetical protein CSB45_15700 [candidate division KSB3 bacterium]
MAGSRGLFPIPAELGKMSSWVLYLLMFLVGMGIGGDENSLNILKESSLKIILVPLAVIAGSLGGAALLSLVFHSMPLDEILAVSAGFGYYSLSSLFITELRGETAGTIALLANIMREIFTLLASPFLARYTGPLGPIASGGATSMDTSLPIITLYSGPSYVLVSLFSGIVLTIAVPFLVPFLLA